MTALDDQTLDAGRRPRRRRGSSPTASRWGTATGRSSTELTVRVPDDRVTVIVGPNACGKSTLLRGMARLLRPTVGAVLLDGEAIHRQSTRHVARDPRPAAAEPGRTRGRHRRRPGRPRTAPAPGRVPALVARGRARRRRGAGADRHRRAGRPGGRRALRRPAAAGLDRDGAGAGHRPAAARRAHDVPRRRPPGRDARPARRPQPRPRHHRRDGAARPQPRPRATPTTWSRCGTARSSRRARPPRSSPRRRCTPSSASATG